MESCKKAIEKLQLAEISLDKAFYFEEWERDELPQLVLDEIRNGRIATALTHIRSAICDLDDIRELETIIHPEEPIEDEDGTIAHMKMLEQRAEDAYYRQGGDREEPF